ncbi:unnamed protein product [Caenorhabditis sp. 36 PRJEB53466]|nr:unnamed protein product [Caenorhabditis sp. 36 PRJEB53466]
MSEIVYNVDPSWIYRPRHLVPLVLYVSLLVCVSKKVSDYFCGGLLDGIYSRRCAYKPILDAKLFFVLTFAVNYIATLWSWSLAFPFYESVIPMKSSIDMIAVHLVPALTFISSHHWRHLEPCEFRHEPPGTAVWHKRVFFFAMCYLSALKLDIFGTRIAAWPNLVPSVFTFLNCWIAFYRYGRFGAATKFRVLDPETGDLMAFVCVTRDGDHRFRAVRALRVPPPVRVHISANFLSLCPQPSAPHSQYSFDILV